MPLFSPPTVAESAGRDRLFSRYTINVGQSVVKKNGHYVTTPFPWLGEIADLHEGIDYFLGGHNYVVSDTVATDLQADGYTVTAGGFGTAGYGVGPYGI